MPPALPTLPVGFGFRRVTAAEMRARDSLLNILSIWEAPRKRGHYKYVVSADVSDGIGQDRSVVEVIRVGSIEEPAEEVAQFVTDSITPTQLAYVVEAVGKLYPDEDGYEALVAIENNNHGLSTQDTLQLHLGYTNHFRWEVFDAAEPDRRYTNRIGWQTTPRTRPILLDKFYQAITNFDDLTGKADLILNSPITIAELRDFQTEGALWEASAARGAHDDCILSTAIGYYVSWRLAGGETIPLEERRRRHALMIANREKASAVTPDFRNMDLSTDEMEWELGNGDEAEEPGLTFFH